ncbi:MAG: hypothetical protein KC766_17130 [Myxococcales bacterium]|nr:hypothetical protein [Myxococcales bacterium]
MSHLRDEQPNPASNSDVTCRRLARGGALCAVFVLAAACSAETRETGKEGVGGTAGSGGTGASGGSAGDGGTGASGGSAGDGGTAGQGGSAGTTGGSAGAGAVGGTGGTSGSGGVGGSGGTAGTGGSAGSGGNPCGTTDPDCECDGTNVVAKDFDGDTHGSKACAANPGDDCDDNDKNFFENACGGCTKNIGGTPGANCNECGVLQCSGLNAVQCVAPNPAPKQCGNATTPETCVGGSWVAGAQCTGSKPACYQGECRVCRPGTYKCVPLGSSDTAVVSCDAGSWAGSYASVCSIESNKVCNASLGKCVTSSNDERDRRFRMPRSLGVDVDAAGRGIPTQEVLDRAVESLLS